MCKFENDLEYSMGNNARVDCEMIKNAIPNCISVVKTNTETDKTGIDYIATLKDGAVINIDGKRRRTVRVVNGYPELALEMWSVMPMIKNGKKIQKCGWVWNTKTDVDMILYTFDEYDKFYLIPFQHLRMAFMAYSKYWVNQYRISKQKNEGYFSQCMFVPADVVIKSVTKLMTFERGADNGRTQNVCKNDN